MLDLFNGMFVAAGITVCMLFVAAIFFRVPFSVMKNTAAKTKTALISKSALWTYAVTGSIAAIAYTIWLFATASWRLRMAVMPLDLVRHVLHNPLPVIFLVGFPVAILLAIPKTEPLVRKIGKGFAGVWTLIFLFAGIQLFLPQVMGLPPRPQNTCTMPYKLGAVHLCVLTDAWTPALPTKGTIFPPGYRYCYWPPVGKTVQWEYEQGVANTYRFRSISGPIRFEYGLIYTGVLPGKKSAPCPQSAPS